MHKAYILMVILFTPGLDVGQECDLSLVRAASDSSNTRDQEAWLVSVAPGEESIAAGEEGSPIQS